MKLIPFPTFSFSYVKCRKQPAIYDLDFLRKEVLEYNTRLLSPLCKRNGLDQLYANLVCTAFPEQAC